MSDISFYQRLDEALKPPSLATILNTRGVIPDPAIIGPKLPGVGDGLDDVDEFESKRGPCRIEVEIVLRDQEGNDVTERLQSGFGNNMGLWVDHSPNWKAHHAWEDFEGNLSVQPPLTGPECVVWVDAPYVNTGSRISYSIIDDRSMPGAWYHPDKALWIDE